MIHTPDKVDFIIECFVHLFRPFLHSPNFTNSNRNVPVGPAINGKELARSATVTVKKLICDLCVCTHSHCHISHTHTVTYHTHTHTPRSRMSPPATMHDGVDTSHHVHERDEHEMHAPDGGH